MVSARILSGLLVGGLCLAATSLCQPSAPRAFEQATDAAPTGHPRPDFHGEAPKQVRVQVEFIDLSHDALTDLLFGIRPDGSDATKLRGRVRDLVKRKEAKVLETQIVVARSGQKATGESIHEFIYPTEYEVAMPQDPKAEEKGNQTACSPLASPTAFETRNVGSTLEIEATIGADASVVDLRFVPELVWHTGETVWAERRGPEGNVQRIQMPDFYTARLNTALACIDGQYTFAGALSPRNERGESDVSRKLMIFVKCDVIEVR